MLGGAGERRGWWDGILELWKGYFGQGRAEQRRIGPRRGEDQQRQHMLYPNPILCDWGSLFEAHGIVTIALQSAQKLQLLTCSMVSPLWKLGNSKSSLLYDLTSGTDTQSKRVQTLTGHGQILLQYV